MDVYALAACLVALLALVASCFAAGRISLAALVDSLRERAERAEALAEDRRLLLVAAAQRRTREAGRDAALARAGDGLDLALAGDGPAPADFDAAADELLRAAGGSAGRPGLAPDAASPSTAPGLGGAGQGVGHGGARGGQEGGPAAHG